MKQNRNLWSFLDSGVSVGVWSEKMVVILCFKGTVTFSKCVALVSAC